MAQPSPNPAVLWWMLGAYATGFLATLLIEGIWTLCRAKRAEQTLLAECKEEGRPVTTELLGKAYYNNNCVGLGEILTESLVWPAFWPVVISLYLDDKEKAKALWSKILSILNCVWGWIKAPFFWVKPLWKWIARTYDEITWARVAKRNKKWELNRERKLQKLNQQAGIIVAHDASISPVREEGAEPDRGLSLVSS